MSPKRADPAVRLALLAAAARVLAEEGPPALSARRMAAETGTSSMSVYTHFGGMDELRRAVRREGFDRLVDELDAVPDTDDPVADLAAAGSVFFTHGVAEPHLYRAMFLDPPPEDPEDPGAAVFERLVAQARRCVAAGRFEAAEETMVIAWAAQLWSMRHGMVTMTVTGGLAAEHARFVLADMTVRLAIGYGDDRAEARQSVERGAATAAAPAAP